jgi:hypothetical protein
MIMPDGRYRDSVCFSIIEAEWPDVKGQLKAKLCHSPGFSPVTSGKLED